MFTFETCLKESKPIPQCSQAEAVPCLPFAFFSMSAQLPRGFLCGSAQPGFFIATSFQIIQQRVIYLINYNNPVLNGSIFTFLLRAIIQKPGSEKRKRS